MKQIKNANDKDAVLAVEKKRIDAYLKRDKQILEGIMSADFYYINSKGKIITKEQLISAIQSRIVIFESIELDDIDIRMFDSTTIMTGKLHEVGESGGEHFDEKFRFTRIYVRQDNNEWQSVAYHSSKIIDE